MARTPQEVFQHHIEALGAADLDEIVADYSGDAILVTAQGAKRGKPGVREGFQQLLSDLPDAEWDIKTTVYEDDVLFLEWGADSEAARTEDGVDTFVFVDGLIRVQTTRYTLQAET